MRKTRLESQMNSMVTTKIKLKKSRKICLILINSRKICSNNQIKAIKIILSILATKNLSKRKKKISLSLKSKNKPKNRIVQ